MIRKIVLFVLVFFAINSYAERHFHSYAHHRYSHGHYSDQDCSCAGQNDVNPLSYWSYELMPTFSYMHYHEDVHNHHFIKDCGEFAGLYGALIYRHPHVLMLQIDARYTVGAIDYEGGSTDEYGNTYATTSSGTPDRLFEMRGIIGRDFLVCHHYLTPYLGIGFRNLFDDSREIISDQNQYGGYFRSANYLYSPLGIQFDILNCGRIAVGGSAEYDIFWRGLMRDGGTGSSYLYHVYEQRSGRGVKFRLRFTGQLSRCTALIVEPFFNHWHVNDSSICFDPNGYAVEPDNTSNEYGIQFALMNV